MNRQLLAWIEIYHPMSNTKFETIKEPCESKAEALAQFNELHKIISQWETEHEGIILDTEQGLLRLPSGFIAGSILQIRAEYEQIEELE